MFNKIINKRNFHMAIQLWGRSSVKKRNPGIGGQIAYVEDAVEAIESDPEGFGDLETNFFDAHKSYRQHELEMQAQRDHIRHIMVKNKYFRQRQLPNMLTYGEKEHIRVLHSRDPEVWTIEHLAESFPATPEIIQKIIKANWKPSSAERLRSHDKKVFENWERFRNGDFDEQLPTELKTHLLKFVERRLEDLKVLPDPAATFIPIELPKPKTCDFQNLITSCAKYKEIDEKVTVEEEEQEKLKSIAAKENFIMKIPKEIRKLQQQQHEQFTLENREKEDETYLVDKVYDKRQMRLQELKKLKSHKLMKIEPSISDDNKMSKNLEHLSMEYLTNPSATGIVKREKSDLLQFGEKFTSSEIVISTEDQKRFEMSTVKDRIHIPRKLWRKNATYRIEDCYYDDDGEFLYRVPGMTAT